MTLHSPDRKSTRLNSSHLVISYAVFCLKKNKVKDQSDTVEVIDHKTSAIRAQIPGVWPILPASVQKDKGATLYSVTLSLFLFFFYGGAPQLNSFSPPPRPSKN